MAGLRFLIPNTRDFFLNKVILMSATLKPAVIGDASSLILLSFELWSCTYLRHGVRSFFTDYRLDDFTKSQFEDVLQYPLEVI